MRWHFPGLMYLADSHCGFRLDTALPNCAVQRRLVEAFTACALLQQHKGALSLQPDHLLHHWKLSLHVLSCRRCKGTFTFQPCHLLQPGRRQAYIGIREEHTKDVQLRMSMRSSQSAP